VKLKYGLYNILLFIKVIKRAVRRDPNETKLYYFILLCLFKTPILIRFPDMIYVFLLIHGDNKYYDYMTPIFMVFMRRKCVDTAICIAIVSNKFIIK